jgi:hypothetical protein
MLAAGYLFALLSVLVFFFALSRYTPASVDIGSVLALRTIAFEDTFDEVKIAEKEIAKGKLESASIRLQRFIERHSDVHPTTLYATAVGDACDLLVQTYSMQGRLGKAEKTAALWSDMMPRNYRAWYVLGKVRKERGDFSAAAEAMGNAFKLTLCLPEITDSYLALLADLNQYERIVWVAKQYTRSENLAAPTVEVFVGPGRSAGQQTIMDLVDLPVGHGQYFVRYDTFLKRGVDLITIPSEIFEQDSRGESMYVMLKFSNVFDHLEVVSVKYRGGNGSWNELEKSRFSVRSLHREHSGAAAFLELKTLLKFGDVSGLEICVASPAYALSSDSQRIIRRAEANLE